MPQRALEMPEFRAGSVWLVGAGPGDPGLLTALALHALDHADAVVHDALIDPRVLALARPGAALIHAGKRGGKPSPLQPDITQRLIRLAREGKRVLRLKGGDPLIFGRGGEEALALVAAGVPFRIVPGVTSALGAAAYAGVPLTHRRLAQTVTFVTGHGAGAEIDTIDWEAVARGAHVIVGYMALAHLGTVAARLVAAGRSPNEPVAVIAEATTPRQRVVETTLARAEADAAGLEPPALVVVGEVARLRAGLDWLGALEGRVLDPDPLRLGLARDAS
jgi:uroporphyrin-III C-methyltransferase